MTRFGRRGGGCRPEGTDEVPAASVTRVAGIDAVAFALIVGTAVAAGARVAGALAGVVADGTGVPGMLVVVGSP